ncbi:GGDEF domain-containing protein [Rhabdochromatium marinum]|uniref:GGDEF domain-containing protein n=1 Tax=Rhabdochromatium marinum TaxID=48729 RepID=UPI001907C2EC|nr:GGDEF domain-containing protein [Rhabdochromatium marinum]
MAATESNRESNPRTRPESAPDLKSVAQPGFRSNSRWGSIKLFFGYLVPAGLVLGVAMFLFYRAEQADATTGVMMGVFGLVLFALIAVGAWFLADAQLKWRRERARAQELADFDRVTDLPNRALFFDRLERIHLHSERYKRRYGLIVLDLDGFGDVNERFGYSDGDQYLIRVGRMLSNRLRNSDTVARVGGDEFAVLLTEVSDAKAAMSLGQKVVAAVAAPMRLSGGEVEITASVGVAVFPEHGGSVDEMLQAADEAMDRAKREGPGRCLMAESPSTYPQADDLTASLMFEDSLS